MNSIETHGDAVRLRFIQALARRAAAHDGDARRILDARLADLLARYAKDREAADAAKAVNASVGVGADEAGRPPRGPIADLVDLLAGHSPSGAHGRDAAGELKTLGEFRSTWSRLSADRRLRQSAATVPENAGPLNSHQLVHRSLALMRALSSAYLERFVSYVDALMWMDDSDRGSDSETSPPSRPEKRKRSGRKASS